MTETPKRKESGKPSYTLAELLAQCDVGAPRTEEERAWIDMPPVGREWGSAEFDELERQAEAPEQIDKEQGSAEAERRRQSAREEPMVGKGECE